MDVIVNFVSGDVGGGPLDGDSWCSDSPDPLVRQKATMVAQVIGGCLRDAEKREVPLNPGLVYSVPNQAILERAKRERWDEAKTNFYLLNHQYEYSGHTEVDGLAVITLKYKGQAYVPRPASQPG